MKKLEEMRRTDMLTGVFNRSYYEEVAESIANDLPETLGVTVININEMKRINDQYGSVFGDAILKEVGKKFCLKYLRAIAFVLTATSLSF